MVASEALTKTTLDDLFDTLKKLEEEEQLATARPDKKNSWCKYLNCVRRSWYSLTFTKSDVGCTTQLFIGFTKCTCQ